MKSRFCCNLAGVWYNGEKQRTPRQPGLQGRNTMSYKRILTIQDISCVGQCSMTVALPVLSAWGLETCVLPTAVLSTHTGGFGQPVVTHLDGAMEATARHWQENGITFDAILVGYLGSIPAVKAAGEILDALLAPGGRAIVDPAMADHGKLYAGFDQDYVQAVRALCRKADILIPNLTEAAMLTEMPVREIMEKDYVNQILDRFGEKTLILTGAGFEKGETGVLVSTSSSRRHYAHKLAGGPHSGTGDLFAACFTGALVQGREVFEAAKLAADFVCQVVGQTENAPAHSYGIQFEPVLKWLVDQM